MSVLALPMAPAGSVQEQVTQQYAYLAQMAQQLQQLSVIVDRLTGSGLTQAMDAPVTGQAGSPDAGGKASPLTAAVQGGAGVTATTARDKAQQAAQPR